MVVHDATVKDIDKRFISAQHFFYTFLERAELDEPVSLLKKNVAILDEGLRTDRHRTGHQMPRCIDSNEAGYLALRQGRWNIYGIFR